LNDETNVDANFPAASLNSFAGSVGIDVVELPPGVPKPGPPGPPNPGLPGDPDDPDALPLRSSKAVPIGFSDATLPGLLTINPTAKL
jgi:hypothetical protein